MLPTRANTLTHTHSVPWTEPEPQNDVVMGANNALLPSFNSMLDTDWYMDQNDSFLMHNFDSSSFSHFAVPSKPSFSSFFTNPFDNNAFDLSSQSEFLAELSSFPTSQQLAGDASVAEEDVFFSKGEAVRPAEGPPTLFRKRAERREGGELGELVLQELKLPLVPPRFAAAAVTKLEMGEDGEGGLNCECDGDDEVGKLVDNGFDGNGNGGKVKGKKKKGMPAKNLMAERRRRKKLNDRLYMLRSVVPKISKMDRASILGDAIDYLKELLQQINDLHNELESSPPGLSLPTSASFHPVTPTLPTLACRVKEELCPTPTSLPSPENQSAKVEVKVREGRAVNIHMFCARKPGLLLSTMKALDNLGLDVQQAVISCFNGFALDVFRAEQCREDQDVLPEQIKAVLLDTAGFHGTT